MSSSWEGQARRAVLRILIIAPAIATAAACARGHPTSPIWGNLDKARAYMKDAANKSGFSGVVLIGRGDETVFEGAYGFADADLRVPMSTRDRFRIGSLTKPITASAVLVAVDHGLLSLDDRACPLLPSCPQSWRPVTVRQLLDHTSGIADHFGDLEPVPVDATVDELRRVLASLPPDEPLLSAPGTKYAYTNFDYVLLGAILEKVGGKPWADVLRSWVFEPLGLKSMAYDDVYAVMRDRVRGYRRDEASGLRNIDYHDHAAYAAGGLLSTAGDLFRWSRGMLTGKLFSTRLVTESVTPNLGNYGLGWQVRRFFARTVYDHTGGIDGFSSHLAFYPDDGLTIIVLSNVENDPAILRACDLAARLFAWPVVARASGPDLTPRQRCGIDH